MEAVAAEVRKRRIPKPVFIRWKLPDPSGVSLTIEEIDGLAKLIAAYDEGRESGERLRCPGLIRLGRAYLELLRVHEEIQRGLIAVLAGNDNN